MRTVSKNLKIGVDRTAVSCYNVQAVENGCKTDADMAELADALDSGSSEVTLMQVQFLLSAPKRLSTKVDNLFSFLLIMIMINDKIKIRLFIRLCKNGLWNFKLLLKWV